MEEVIIKLKNLDIKPTDTGMGKGSIFSGELVVGGDNSAETAISPSAKETNHPRNLFYNIFSSYSENALEKSFGGVTKYMLKRFNFFAC